MTIDPAELRRVGAHFATGVTVVTAEHGGVTCGLTVNAFMTVSLEPPLVLISIGTASRSLGCLETAARFGISVLGEDQEAIARVFAGKDDDKLATVPARRGATGVPLIDGSIAWLECRTERRTPAGDHILFLAAVEALGVRGGKPLLFYGGQYARLAHQ
ncbi:MAG TPA: flavin reductase family protein [Candidatus Limnocylindria bacterium]|nr:flavin reductase family protein [Candidatus Limnocylindria bacterium]